MQECTSAKSVSVPTDRQTDRQTADRQAGRQADRQTDRQTDRPSEKVSPHVSYGLKSPEGAGPMRADDVQPAAGQTGPLTKWPREAGRVNFRTESLFL